MNDKVEAKDFSDIVKSKDCSCNGPEVCNCQGLCVCQQEDIIVDDDDDCCQK